MLELLESKRNLNGNGWHRPVDTAYEKKALTFELLPNRLSTNSATFSIYRARIPGGWLVASRPNDSLTFVPDPQHEWDGSGA